MYQNWFVSQPMSGLTMDEIRKDRDRANLCILKIVEKEWKSEDRIVYEILDNLAEDIPGYNSLDYLADDIKYLAKADCVFFCKGWETHRGCLCEFEIATRFGIPCYFE